MATGIRIMGKITLPCKVVQLEEKVFQIVLIQGMNRQIRRICYQLGYEVTQLKRVRIGNVVLEDLRPMNYRVVEKSICYDFR
jgi:23S rRNA pseudouridine2604 synthase